MFISDAYADSAPTPAPAATTASTATTPDAADVPAPSPMWSVAPILVIFVFFYFMMIRPNQRRIRDFQDMVKGLKRGDRVVTGGGIIGVIQKIENDEVLVVEIAPDIKVRVMRETISSVVSKTATAVNDN